MRLHIHIDSITKGYSRNEILRNITALKDSLRLNAIGAAHARGARRNGYLEEKATLEKELKEFEEALLK